MNRRITRAALLLALTVVCQSLRLVLPVPPIFSTLLIGSLVNTCLITAYLQAGWQAALLIGAVAPLVAFWQGLLPLVVFILPVAAGNAVYIGVFHLCRNFSWLRAGSLAAVAKTVLVYLAFYQLVLRFALPLPVVRGLMLAMSWPQLVTAMAGVYLAREISRRLKPDDHLPR
ncbi:MAG: hypothetical protein N3A57_00655 [Negativicutes bacterium]|nr:hypothetical protein [Negativicutes bacterium]